MKILYIVDYFYPNKWWIEVLLYEIIGYFSKKHDVKVITFRYDKNLPEVEKINWWTVYRVDAKSLYHFYFTGYNKAKEFIEDIDIIHSNTFFSALIWWKLSKNYKKQHIVHVHWAFWVLRKRIVSRRFKFFKYLKFSLLEKLIFRQNADFLCVSKYVYDVLDFVYWVDLSRLHLIYNWIDEKKWLNCVDLNEVEKIKGQISKKGEFVFLFYWRKEKVKNIDLLISAFKKANIPNSKLVLLLSDFWKSWERKIEENIEFYPAVDHNNLPNWIKAANVVVYPSIVESFGYVGLETSLLEKPIVASNMWAIPEVVYWKVRFFNPFDEDDLIKALKDAYKGNFEVIPKKDFSINNVFKKLERLYEEKLG